MFSENLLNFFFFMLIMCSDKDFLFHKMSDKLFKSADRKLIFRIMNTVFLHEEKEENTEQYYT